MTDRDRDEDGRPRYAGPRDRLGRPVRGRGAGEMEDAVDPAETAPPLGEAIATAIALFDAGRFFEAHEFFEYVWKHREVQPRDRDFWKGVTQAAVGFCHVQRGNAPGALATLDRAVRYLARYPAVHRGVDTTRLVAAVRQVVSRIEDQGAGAVRFPRFPRSSGRPAP